MLIIKGLELAKCGGSLKSVKDCILQVTEAPTTQSIPNNVTYVIWNVIQYTWIIESTYISMLCARSSLFLCVFFFLPTISK